jgi:hypothetical protein
MRFKAARLFQVLLSLSLSALLWGQTALLALAQEPTPPSTLPEEQSVLLFFGWMLGLGLGMVVLTLLIIGFVLWANGTPARGVGASLRQGTQGEGTANTPR